MDDGVRQQAREVLDVLSRARNVFGGNTTPDRPPAFAPPTDLEQDLGRGLF